MNGYNEPSILFINKNLSLLATQIFQEGKKAAFDWVKNNLSKDDTERKNGYPLSDDMDKFFSWPENSSIGIRFFLRNSCVNKLTK